MPLIINLRHLEDKNLQLRGEISAEELQLDSLDELIHSREPLIYDLEAEKLEKNVLVQGTLRLKLDCECARCLKAFPHEVCLPKWVGHLALEGEDAATVNNDCLDLTLQIREDILLAFPQHPLCEPECGGLRRPPDGPEATPGSVPKSTETSSAWAELNKLKFED